MDEARGRRSLPCRSTTRKRRGERLTPEPLSGPGARARSLVALRSSLDFGWGGTGFVGVLVILRPDVLEVFGERVDRLAVFVGGGEISGSGCVGVGFDGVHFRVWFVVVSLTGNGKRFAHCPNNARTISHIVRNSFPPLNVQAHPRGEEKA
jgi:hypothetical protein